MHPELRSLFTQLEELLGKKPFGVIGSAVQDYERAGDVDVLLPHSIEWKDAVKALKTKYNGWDTPSQGHIRRANIKLWGVSKPIQVLQIEKYPTVADHPFAAMFADGRVIKPDKVFDKEKDALPWK